MLRMQIQKIQAFPNSDKEVSCLVLSKAEFIVALQVPFLKIDKKDGLARSHR